jgi:ERCC4-type nuclease
MEYGDAMFEGNGPGGVVLIGIERKTLGDMLQCVEDARYASHQLPGMKMLYSKSYLSLEGLWAPGTTMEYSDKLMVGYRNGSSWGPFKQGNGRTPMYAKLFRYLLSVGLAGVTITQSLNLWHTAYNICEIFAYYQKPWKSHTSLQEVQKVSLPVMFGKPSLTMRWASDIEDVGVIMAAQAEAKFKTPFALATSEEMDWLTLEGMGVPRARRIIREIRGWKA